MGKKFFPYVVVTDNASVFDNNYVKYEPITLPPEIEKLRDKLLSLWLLDDRIVENEGFNYAQMPSKYELTGIEKYLYAFLDTIEVEIFYLAMKGMSQELIGSFYDVGQSVISFRILRLQKKLNDVFYRNVVLLSSLQDNYYELSLYLTQGELLFLIECIICMDKVKVCSTLSLSNFLVTKVFYRIIYKICFVPSLWSFVDRIDSLFKWGVLGRSYYKKD